MAAAESFLVTADYLAIVADTSGDVDQEPDITIVSATIYFEPRLPTGHTFHAATYTGRPTDIAIPVTEARIDEGRLKQKNGQLGVKLIANTAVLARAEPLIYDVRFDKVRFNKTDQTIRAFAFTAPTAGGVTVNLTTVARLPYRTHIPDA